MINVNDMSQEVASNSTCKLELDMVEELGVQVDTGVIDKLIKVLVELVEPGDGHYLHLGRCGANDQTAISESGYRCNRVVQMGVVFSER